MVVYARLLYGKSKEIVKPRSWIFYVLILILLLFLIPAVLFCINLIIRLKSINFDGLIFTQDYPVSNCIKYKEESPSHQCNFASDKQAWSIHGIWPSTFGRIGPIYCKRECFNASMLKPIRSELDIQWYSFMPNTNEEFWEHEWLKHGSCAEQLPSFNTELKYFSLGLIWNKKYNINEMLEAAGIVPNNSHTLKREEFETAIATHTGFKPIVACILEQTSNSHLIFEIRICFDNEENFMSCDKFESEDSCPDDGILYPETSSMTRP